MVVVPRSSRPTAEPTRPPKPTGATKTTGATKAARTPKAARATVVVVVRRT